MSETNNPVPEAPESPTEFLDAVRETASAQPDLTAQPEPELEPEPEPAPKPDKVERRIANLTRRMAEADRAREAAERERDAALALANVDKADAATPRRDAHADVETRAAALLAEREFNRRLGEIDNSGKETIGADQWEQAKATLQGLGATGNQAFLQALAETENPAKLFAELAEDTDVLMDLLSKPPVAMAARLARMDAKLSSPVVRPLSSAPTPAPRIKASGVVPEASPHSYPSNMSMKAWSKMMDAHLPPSLGGKRKPG